MDIRTTNHVRGKKFASDAAWQRFKESYEPVFWIEYEAETFGQVQKHRSFFTREMVFDFLSRNMHKIAIALPEQVFPEPDDALLRRVYTVFTTVPYAGWDLSDEVDEITYIVSDVSMAYKALGMTTYHMAELMRTVMPFIRSVDEDGKHPYLEAITELDHFVCPQCQELHVEALKAGKEYQMQIMHVSYDTCSKCGWENPDAIHHFNTTPYEEWKASNSMESVVGLNHKIDTLIDFGREIGVFAPGKKGTK